MDQLKMEHAMNFLATTDQEFSQFQVAVRRAEILQKRVRARVLLTSEGTEATRKALAETHSDTIAADDDYIKALSQFEALKAKRQTKELIIDVWRSLEASRRKA